MKSLWGEIDRDAIAQQNSLDRIQPEVFEFVKVLRFPRHKTLQELLNRNLIVSKGLLSGDFLSLVVAKKSSLLESGGEQAGRNDFPMLGYKTDFTPKQKE